VLQSQMKSMWQARDKMVEQVNALSDRMSDEDSRRAGNCAVCRPWGRGPKCVHCHVEKTAMMQYEQQLYSLTRDKQGRGGDGEDEPVEPMTTTATGTVDPQLARLAWNMKEFSRKKKAVDISRSPAEPEVVLAALLRFLGSSNLREHAVRAATAPHQFALTNAFFEKGVGR
jgi:hypothetical protein